MQKELEYLKLICDFKQKKYCNQRQKRQANLKKDKFRFLSVANWTTVTERINFRIKPIYSVECTHKAWSIKKWFNG